MDRGVFMRALKGGEVPYHTIFVRPLLPPEWCSSTSRQGAHTMHWISTHVASVIAAVIGALVFIVTVCRSCPRSRVISSRWRRVGSVMFWVALAAWSVWLL